MEAENSNLGIIFHSTPCWLLLNPRKEREADCGHYLDLMANAYSFLNHPPINQTNNKTDGCQTENDNQSNLECKRQALQYLVQEFRIKFWTHSNDLNCFQ